MPGNNNIIMAFIEQVLSVRHSAPSFPVFAASGSPEEAQLCPFHRPGN